MSKSRLSPLQRTVLDMFLLDPPTDLIDIRAATAYVTVIAEDMKHRPDNGCSCKACSAANGDLVLVDNVAATLLTAALMLAGQADNWDAVQDQLRTIHPSLAANAAINAKPAKE
jgi:hypothetical protein